jgi:hypothetical protein
VDLSLSVCERVTVVYVGEVDTDSNGGVCG